MALAIAGGASATLTPWHLSAPLHAARAQTGAPQAVIAAGGDAVVNTPYTFDGSGSQGANLQYRWDFGDGSPIATGARVQHTYTSVDDVTVTLTVQDASGATASATQQLRVVPALGEFDGLPALGQITPASAFKADLHIDLSGITTGFSVSVGGPLLSSQVYDYTGGGPSFIELPEIHVANEDDPNIRPLIDEQVTGIPLANNVQVTVAYTTPSGARESVTYTTSLVQPPGVGITTSPLASTATPTPTPTPAPRVTPGPRPAITAAPAPGNPGSPVSAPQERLAGYLQQATQTPVPIRTMPPTQTPVPIRTIPPTQTSVPIATPTPAPQPVVWSITYPTYLPIVGRPANEDDVDNYYLTGDSDFHHADDPLVRRFAIKIARAGGTFPNDPKQAVDNIYRYVYGLLGIGDPGKFENDVQILRQVVSGELVPGSRSVEFICIAHAYFFSSLTRELGLPTREETIGLARPDYQDSDGLWHVKYYQEGANEVWYGGAWHHYDTWIGTRDRDSYLDIYLAEAAWYAYSPQRTPFLDAAGQPTGLAGHDFGIAMDDGTPGDPSQWRFIEQHVRPGIKLAQPVPASYMSIDAPRASHGPIARPQIVPAGNAD